MCFQDAVLPAALLADDERWVIERQLGVRHGKPLHAQMAQAAASHRGDYYTTLLISKAITPDKPGVSCSQAVRLVMEELLLERMVLHHMEVRDGHGSKNHKQGHCLSDVDSLCICRQDACVGSAVALMQLPDESREHVRILCDAAALLTGSTRHTV
jgi:hypothetical protein